MYRKVADDVRKIAIDVLAAEGGLSPQDAGKVLDEVAKLLEQRLKSGKPVTAAEIEAFVGGGLAKSVAVAFLLGLGALAPAKAGEAVDIIKGVADSLQTIRVEEKGTLPGPKSGTLAGTKIVITTNAQDKAFKYLNELDKKMAEQGVKQDARSKALLPLIQGMGMEAKS